MAKRDVNLYYLQVQKEYLEMVDSLKDVQEAYETGYIDYERFQQAMQDIETIRANYERLSYIMFLLRKPAPRKKRAREQEERMNKEWYAALSGASKEAILDETRDVLADFKAMTKKDK